MIHLFLSLCRAFFDHSMHSALPLGIYLATKFWMYATWFYWFWNDILYFIAPVVCVYINLQTAATACRSFTIVIILIIG